MPEKRFKGTGVALVTPFTEKLEVDYDALSRLVEHVIAGGVDFLVALGTTAETPTLTSEEKKSILKHIVAVNGRRLPLVCGIGGNDTRDILLNFESYPLDGVDAILSVSPYYNKPSQRGILAHFKALDREAPRPIILYNVPGRTGSNMSSDLTAELAHTCKNILGVKEAAGNMVQSMELIKKCPPEFTILSGDDDLTMAQMACGFDGVISVAANCFTKTFSSMVRAAAQDDFKSARENHYAMLDGIGLLFAEGNPAGVKSFLHKMNLCQNTFRLPVVAVSEPLEQKINAYPVLP